MMLTLHLCSVTHGFQILLSMRCTAIDELTFAKNKERKRKKRKEKINNAKPDNGLSND